MESFIPNLKFTSLLAQAESGIESSLAELGQTPIYIMCGYLVLLLILGIVGWMKSQGGEEDYYLAGRGQGWLVSSVTIMATFFSSFALLGAPGMVYREGLMFALFSLNVPVAGLCVYLLGSRIWKVGRKFGYVTPGDMAADYYGSKVSLKLLDALASVLYVMPYVVMQIQSGGIISAKLFPGNESSFTIGATVLAAITMAYIMIGGMRSVAWTDLVQGILLIVGMLISGFAMFMVFDGPMNFAHEVTTKLPASSLTIPGNTQLWHWSMIFTVCILGSSGSMVQPAQWMRFYSADSVQTLKRGAVIFAVVLTTCFILGVMLIGLAGQILYPLTFTLTEEVANAPASIEIPAELQNHVSYATSEDGSATLSWKWQGNDRQPIAESEIAQLSNLSDSASFGTAVNALASKVSDPKNNPGSPSAHRSIKDYNSILVVVISKELPAQFGKIGGFMASLILVAIMAASMSTADSNLHALSAVTTRDVYDRFIRPQASEKERVWVGRAVIAVTTIVALLIVIVGDKPEFKSQYDIMSMIAMMGLMAIAFSAQLLPIAIDMLFLHKGTGKGAACGLAAGLFAAFLFGPLFSMLVSALGSPEFLVSILDRVSGTKGLITAVHGSVWGLVFNVPIFALVSLVTKKPDAEKVQQYRDVLK
jgi:Na+/proline symporter